MKGVAIQARREDLPPVVATIAGTPVLSNCRSLWHDVQMPSTHFAIFAAAFLICCFYGPKFAANCPIYRRAAKKLTRLPDLYMGMPRSALPSTQEPLGASLQQTEPMPSPSTRLLVVVADDFGMGPSTSAGILDVADRGAVTASVLLVNSPYAQDAVRCWRQRGCPMELGWHPNLTLDAPAAPAAQVASLLGPDGKFCPLKVFLRRWALGTLNAGDIERELRAQLERFCDLVGHLPTVVNTHQHVGVFAPVGDVLMKVLLERGCKPYLRRVREPLRVLWTVPGARIKRSLLNGLGRRLARRQEAQEFPGNDWLAGITDPKWVKDAHFFGRWLRAVPGQHVELMCHPGYQDPTLLGRDCRLGDGLLQRRVDELLLLKKPSFQETVQEAGFTLATPAALSRMRPAHVDVA
jgi:predicted glycoside hydrolase/deacetylase ChbG (UPF0249 family)